MAIENVANGRAAGVSALCNLINAIGIETSRQFAEAALDVGVDADTDGDPCNYVALAQMVEQSILQDFVNAEKAHREGYLRAVTYLFSLMTSGGLPDFDTWDPIGVTEPSFAASHSAESVIDRAKGSRNPNGRRGTRHS